MIFEEKSYNKTINFFLNKFHIKIRKHTDDKGKDKNNNTFDLIPLPREGISNYEFVINKIKDKIKEKNKDNLKALKDNNLCLYIMKVNLKTIKIYNKEDWDDYYENGIIQKYIEEKKNSELKFEYAFFKDNYIVSENHKINKLQNILSYYEPINFIEKIIDFIKNNENFLIEFKNNILQTIKFKNNSIKNKYKNEYFSLFLSEKVNEIKDKLNKLTDINTSIKDINNKIINSEILSYIPKNKEIKSMYEPKTNLNLKNITYKESNNNINISNNDEEDYILNFNDNDEITFSSFLSFYKNRDKFRENLKNETMNSINPLKISNI